MTRPASEYVCCRHCHQPLSALDIFEASFAAGAARRKKHKAALLEFCRWAAALATYIAEVLEPEPSVQDLVDQPPPTRSNDA